MSDHSYDPAVIELANEAIRKAVWPERWSEASRSVITAAVLDSVGYSQLLAIAEAAEKGFARSECGSCDAGLPMGCTCNEMDAALDRWHEYKRSTDVS